MQEKSQITYCLRMDSLKNMDFWLESVHLLSSCFILHHGKKL